MNIYQSIQASKTQSLKRFLTALAIKNVGKETADVLAHQFGNLQNLMRASLSDLSDIIGFGSKIGEDIYLFFQNEKNRKMLAELKKLGVIPTPVALPKSELFKAQSVVITGTLKSMARDEASELIKLHGGKVSSSVSKNTSYLIVGENPGSKLDKAQNLDVTILTEEQFLEMIEGQSKKD